MRVPAGRDLISEKLFLGLMKRKMLARSIDRRICTRLIFGWTDDVGSVSARDFTFGVSAAEVSESFGRISCIFFSETYF